MSRIPKPKVKGASTQSRPSLASEDSSKDLSQEKSIGAEPAASGPLGRSAEHLQALYTISQSVSDQLSLHEIFTQVSQLLTHHVACDRVTVAVLDSDLKTMRILDATDSELGTGLNEGAEFPLSEAQILEIRQRSRPQVHPASHASLEVEQGLRRGGLSSFMTLPLRRRGSVFALLHLAWKKAPELDEGDLLMLGAFAGQFSTAVAGAMLYERILANEEELSRVKRVEAMGQLAGGIAHDFNNLLGVIEMHLELADRRQQKGENVSSALASIRSATRRAAELTDQLLAVGRRRPLSLQCVDVDLFVSDSLHLLSPVLGPQIQVLSNLNSNAPAQLDRGSMEQVLLNLLLNARDSMPQGGIIRVSSSRLELGGRASVQLTIEDNGCGMNRETQRRIFEPFFTTKGSGGTGLGMATVAGIVAQLEGTISVESEEGVGSRFILRFPEARAAAPGSSPSVAPPPPASEPAASSPRASGPRTRARILLVEDQSALRQATRHLLEELGYEVEEAHDGSDALGVLRESQELFDLVLSDLQMRPMGGVELAHRLQDTHPDLKLLFMSGFSENLGGRARSTISGKILKKPLSARTLDEAIQATLLSDEQGASDALY